MSAMYGDRMTVIRAEPVTDAYGNPSAERDWDNAERTQYRRVSVQPAEMMEEAGNRPMAVSTGRVYSMPGTTPDVLRTDRIELSDGSVWEVHGDARVYTMQGSRHHIEFNIRKVAG